MNRQVKNDLIKAKEFKTVGKNKEALEFYKKAYDENPDVFTPNQKTDFAWTIYRAKMTHFTDEEELYTGAEFITTLLSQKDFNKTTSCPYTSAVFKVLNHLKNLDDYPSMIPWLEKLNPDLLDEKVFRKYGSLCGRRK